ncbi:SET domain-containing protein [Pholiota conissans]|uniref:SET domain-containing protein n=1 Tax=Pholiota conissans TaxID=109636 RepID=A0A9P5Z8Q3_9AGAR|nr:SET domain-containing protein [Pholiota conissans]
MLDAGVDALLPHSYPPLRACLPDTFSVSDAGAKGKGLFARRHIRNMEVILTERPAVITPYIMAVAAPSPQLYADIFGKLSKDVYNTLVDFEAHKSMDHESLIRVNALAIPLSVPDYEYAELPTHRGIFLQTGRCNHSCGPNAKWDWDLSSFSLTLSAVREIRVGEEITIAYVPLHLPQKEREASLRDMYDFSCVCEFCAQSSDEINKSDSARKFLAKFWYPEVSCIPSFEDWCKDDSLPSDMLLNAHKDAMNAILQEGLHVLDTECTSGHVHPQRDLGRHIDKIAMCYGAMEDIVNFRAWTQKALDTREYTGHDTKLVFKKWLSNPASFPCWGWRTHPSKVSNPDARSSMDSRKIMPP